MKRLLLALGIALAAPSSMAAQSPLAIYCSSPTQDYCMSILTWETTLHSGTEFSSVRASVQLYGDALEASTGWFAVWMAQVDMGPAISQVGFDGAGKYVANDSPVRAPTGTVADFYGMTFGTMDESGSLAVFGCQVGVDCVEVPEPSSVLLLASGLLGLAYVRRRWA